MPTTVSASEGRQLLAAENEFSAWQGHRRRLSEAAAIVRAIQVPARLIFQLDFYCFSRKEIFKAEASGLGVLLHCAAVAYEVLAAAGEFWKSSM